MNNDIEQPNVEETNSRFLLNCARVDMIRALSDLCTVRELFTTFGYPDASRAMSVAITQLETALLWADKAEAELPPP